MALWEGATPADLIDDLGHAIAERYRRIENALEVRLRRALEQSIAAPPDLAERVRVVRELRSQAERLLADLPPDQVAQVVAQIAGEAASAEIARQLFTLPGINPAATTVGAGGLFAVAAAEIDLRDTLRALNARIYRAPADAYQRMTAQTLPDMLLGRSTWEQVQRRQVDRYLADGIAGFVDQGGRRWRIGSYAEMATRTASARAWRDQSVASMAQHGIDTFTPVIGSDACANCAAWYGKVLTERGPVGPVMVPNALTGEPESFRVDGTLEQARAAGWGHPNCRCVLRPAMPGYTVAGSTTYDPEHERQRDQMRALERDVRDARRNGGNVGDAQQALRDFTREHGLRRRYWREQLAFSGG